MAKGKIVIGMPAYGGMVHMLNALSLLQTQAQCQAMGLQVGVIPVLHESLIQRGRNCVVHEFLKVAEDPEDRLLFIDSDIQFDPSAVLALRDTDFPVVGAAYPKKRLDKESIEAAIKAGAPNPWAQAADYFVRPEVPENQYTQSDGKWVTAPIQVEKGCIPSHWVGTGFLMMKAQALLDMIRAYPETAYVGDMPGTNGEVIHALFDCEISHEDGGVYLSEDYLFCKRWRKMGNRVMVHCGIRLDHIGVHTYEGNPGKIFRPSEGGAQ